MPLYQGNDTDLVSDPLTDSNGAEIIAGTVEVTILDLATPATVHFTKTAMTHDAGGVWKKKMEAEDMDAIPGGTRVIVRITGGDPQDATFEREVLIQPRRN